LPGTFKEKALLIGLFSLQDVSTLKQNFFCLISY